MTLFSINKQFWLGKTTKIVKFVTRFNTSEVDHIIAVKHGGVTTEDNLAFSCLSCNRYKGSDFATIDKFSQEIVPLFNPRHQVWNEYFFLNGARIEGRTQIGQGTARLLQLNLPNRMLERQVLISQNLYP